MEQRSFSPILPDKAVFHSTGAHEVPSIAVSDKRRKKASVLGRGDLVKYGNPSRLWTTQAVYSDNFVVLTPVFPKSDATMWVSAQEVTTTPRGKFSFWPKEDF